MFSNEASLRQQVYDLTEAGVLAGFESCSLVAESEWVRADCELLEDSLRSSSRVQILPHAFTYAALAGERREKFMGSGGFEPPTSAL